MGIMRPLGPYAEEMLEPGGWPEVDEDELFERAQQFTEVRAQLVDVHSTCRQQMSQIFEGGVWAGGAAGAAHAKLLDYSLRLQELVTELEQLSEWHDQIAASITQTKLEIYDAVLEAQIEIQVLETDPAELPAIEGLVAAVNAMNVILVTALGEEIQEGLSLFPEVMFGEITPDQPESLVASPTPSDTPVAPSPASSEALPGRMQPVPGEPAPAPSGPPAAAPRPTELPPLAAPQLTPAMHAPLTAHPAGSTRPVPRDPAAEPPAPVGPVAAPPRPSAAGPGNGEPPSELGTGSPSHGLPPGRSPLPPQAPAAPAAAPAAAARLSTPPMASTMSMAPVASGGAAAGQGVGSSAPIVRAGSGGPPATPPAGSASKAPGLMRPDAGPSLAAPTPSASAGVLTSIPVSVARAARDAVAVATTARRTDDPDPLRLARRIAAALNAPDSGGVGDFGFWWVTAVTTDDAIVVANSYGLAYIPAGVQLPKPVRMASADEAIPASDRARWATHPVIAVQGWADHRNTWLRAVIATEEQLANSDPGAPKMVLESDDIPATGTMGGRSRLEVVAPEAAGQLAATPDDRLIDLLPPPPVAVDPPADQRHTLWFEVLKPLTSDAAGRDSAHLGAFHRYAAHAQEVILGQAHTAVDFAAQRAAVAEWLYWQHITGLLDATSAGAKVPV
ncbi:hypothetical protein [Mycobacterium spongiae]|uniref:Outer membrane channel protein CpnT-like N-terminal domain-containing protein n=1 Tax=Mycobacterium spongiae TaxID=886343 RepID=A0A975PWB9_9MYCO|nr:hypothetical protein [Mycobacterium spongiae]QUR66523.1 hypothetical protein F6B93_04955 [Mycobacterium spongiae]